jgi:hypothetical protein
MPIIDTKIELNKDLALFTVAHKQVVRLVSEGHVKTHLHSLPGRSRTSLDNVAVKEIPQRSAVGLESGQDSSISLAGSYDR